MYFCGCMYKRHIPYNTDNQGTVFLEEQTTPKILPFYNRLRLPRNS